MMLRVVLVCCICEYRTTLFVCFCVYLFVCLSCRSYALNSNSQSIICIFICVPCFYRVATAIHHFMTDSRCICLIHLCKVVFLNFAPSPAVNSHFNHWTYVTFSSHYKYYFQNISYTISYRTVSYRLG